MILLQTCTLIVCLAAFGFCSPMKPRNNNKGKGIAQPSQEEFQQQFLASQPFISPGYENLHSHMYPMIDNINYAAHYHDVSTDVPSMNWQQSGQDWHMHGHSTQVPDWQGDYQDRLGYSGQHHPFHVEMEQQHRHLNQGQASNSYRMGNLKDGLFDDSDMASTLPQSDDDFHIGEDGMQHQQSSSRPKTDITQEGLNNLMQQLFGNEDASSDHSQSDNEYDLHSSRPTVEPVPATTEKRKAKGRNRGRQPNSRRFLEKIKNDEVLQLWARNGLSVDMDPTVLAREVVLLRLVPGLTVNTITIGKRSAQIIKKARLNPDGSKKEKDAYLTTFLETLRAINTRISRVKEHMSDNPDFSRSFSPEQYEEYAVREAIKLFEQARAVQDNGVSSNKRVSSYQLKQSADMNKVGALLMQQIANKHLEFDALTPVELSNEALELSVPGMVQKEVIKHVRNFLAEHPGVGGQAGTMITYRERMEKAKARAQIWRDRKREQRNAN